MARPKTIGDTELISVRLPLEQTAFLRDSDDDLATHLRSIIQKVMDDARQPGVLYDKTQNEPVFIPKLRNTKLELRNTKPSSAVIPSDKKFMDDFAGDDFQGDDTQESFDDFPTRELE